MKRFLALFLLAFALFFAPTINAQADESDKPQSHVTITVVMPGSAPEDSVPTTTPSPPPSLPYVPELDPPPTPTPAPTPSIPLLYPTGVYDVLENGISWIVKTYELGFGENPADIPRDSFERDGWKYSITDVTKKETAATDVRDVVEIVTLNTETKDMEAILRQLSPTIDFTSEDGYVGVLTLDVASIAVETAGTKTSNYTASATREYPHLSANDTSLVPKNITDGGRTLTLASVDWKTNYSTTVDYEQIPASYTAVATYTAAASRTVVTGYITTAEYKGSLAKLSQGKTIYTAYFMGKEIVPERISLEIIEPSPTPTPTPESTLEPTPEPTPEAEIEAEEEAEAEVEAEAETEAEEAAPEKGGNLFLILIPAILFALLIGLGAGYYVPKIIKNRKGDAIT